jgi:hypothetical protein
MIKQSMVDLENLFTLLDEPIEVADVDNARRLEVIDAEVKVAAFNNTYAFLSMRSHAMLWLPPLVQERIVFVQGQPADPQEHLVHYPQWPHSRGRWPDRLWKINAYAHLSSSNEQRATYER